MTLSVHGLPGPALAVDEARSRTARGRLRMLLVLAVCAAPVVASYLTYFVIRPEGRSNHGSLIVPSRSLPEALPLRALDGTPVAPRSLRGQWLLVAVGPARCEGACERRLYAQRQLREMLGRERERLDKVWLVTDSAALPPALQQALNAAPGLTVLRTDRQALARWLEPAPAQALEDHLYVVDPMGEWMLRFPVNIEPARIKRDLDRLLRASASWDQAGR